MERKPSEVSEELDEFLSDYLFPPKEDGSQPRACPQCIAEGREGGRLALGSLETPGLGSAVLPSFGD